MADYTKLPLSLQRGMRDYLEHHLPPGQFLAAVLRWHARRELT